MEMKLKKLVALVFAVVVMACVSVVYADSATTLTVSSVNAEPGTDVEVTIDLSGNETGILGMMVSVSYDEDLTLKKVVAGDALSSLDFTPGKNLTANPINIGWDGLDADSTNGTVAVLTFTVPENAKGIYNIGISYSAGNIYDNDFNDIDVLTVGGCITVNSPPVVTETSMSYDNLVKETNSIVFDVKLTSPDDISGKVYVALYNDTQMVKLRVYDAAETVNAVMDSVNGKYIKIMWLDNEYKPITDFMKIDL